MSKKSSKKVGLGPPNLNELPPFDPREFRWPVEWVEEIADRLANKDSGSSEQANKESDYWKQWGNAAIRYLDCRRNGCLDAIRESGVHEAWLRERNFMSLPRKISFAEAVLQITGQSRNDRALRAFEIFLATLIFENVPVWRQSVLREIPPPATFEEAMVAAKDWMKDLKAFGECETAVAMNWAMVFAKYKEAKISTDRQRAAHAANKKWKKVS